MSARPRFKRALVFGATLLGAVTPLLAEETAATPPDLIKSLEEQVQLVYRRCQGAIVRIEATDTHGQLAGTGFFVDPTGTLFTSYTIGGDTRDIVVLVGQSKFAAHRLVADERSGIAILKVEAKTPFLTVGSTEGLALASPIMTMGYPMDLPLTPSFGIVGGFDRKYLGRYFATTHLRANLAVQRGEGGAPLLNMKGEAVGILISTLDQGSASFVLPIEAAEKIRKDFVRFGDVRPGWIGMTVVTAQEARGGSTALVEAVFDGAPAERAGIQPADMLLAVGSRKISSPEDMVDACFFLSAEELVQVKVDRNGEEVTIPVETTDFPGRRISPRALSLSRDPSAPPPVKIGD